MRKPEGINLDIIELSEQSGNDDANRLTAARQKTKSLFQTWRSRFSTESVRASYYLPVGPVLIDSQTPDSVRLIHVSVKGDKTYYDLNLLDGVVNLNVTSPPNEPLPELPQDQLELQRQDEMAKFLYYCDRVIMRGRGVST